MNTVLRVSGRITEVPLYIVLCDVLKLLDVLLCGGMNTLHGKLLLSCVPNRCSKVTTKSTSSKMPIATLWTFQRCSLP